MKWTVKLFTSCSILALLTACQPSTNARSKDTNIITSIPVKLPASTVMGKKIAHAAEAIVDEHIVYDPSYFVIQYPNGDIPKGKGVCTDVVIRTLRRIGIDLQQQVHEDMKKHYALYPKIWGRTSTDKNIDHRRVPNLMTFFDRKRYSRPITDKATDYWPGDVVAWRLAGGQTHIGVVSHTPNRAGTSYLIVHNIGSGQVLEDCLFSFTIIGHYRL